MQALEERSEPESLARCSTLSWWVVRTEIVAASSEIRPTRLVSGSLTSTPRLVSEIDRRTVMGALSTSRSDQRRPQSSPRRHRAAGLPVACSGGVGRYAEGAVSVSSSERARWKLVERFLRDGPRSDLVARTGKPPLTRADLLGRHSNHWTPILLKRTNGAFSTGRSCSL
jgi:hypothetical protein